jgi:mannose-6-phosphate isomerase
VNVMRLGPNQVHRFYRGGATIAAFRGSDDADDRAPEDWVGSTTEVFGDHGAGLSRLPDGRLLRDAVAAEPEAFLGPERAARHGADPGVLVKLLDAGERLPVHLHPDGAFAARELGSPYGKTEAWIVAATGGADAVVHVGFRDEIERETLEGWVGEQDAEAMLAALNPLHVVPGDAVFVPAGLPHAIGAGIFIVEVQEPSDLSILLEWAGFAIDGRAEGHLGLGFDRALGAVDRSAWKERVAALHAARGEGGTGVSSVLPRDADSFFRAERVGDGAELDPAFAILVVVAGAGSLEGDGGATPLARGDTILVPYAAGACRVSGDVEAIRCLAGAA